MVLPISEGRKFRIRQFERVCYCRPPSSPAVRCKPLDGVDVSVEHFPSNLSHLSNCPKIPLAVEAEPCLRFSFLCQLFVGVQPMFCPCPTCGEAGWKAEIEPTPQPPLFSSRAAAVKGALAQTSWLGPGQMPMTKAAHRHKPGRQQGRPTRVPHVVQTLDLLFQKSQHGRRYHYGLLGPLLTTGLGSWRSQPWISHPSWAFRLSHLMLFRARHGAVVAPSLCRKLSRSRNSGYPLRPLEFIWACSSCDVFTALVIVITSDCVTSCWLRR